MIEAFEGSLLFVGAGKMGGAILAGLLEEGLDPGKIIVQDPSPPPDIADLLDKYDIIPAETVNEGVKLDVVVLAVKPQIFEAVLPSIHSCLAQGTLVLSIAAGKTLSNIEKHIGGNKPVIRAMPNTPASIGRGMSVLVANAFTTDEHKELATALFSAIGDTAWIENEADMDAVTALSGSGPAYIFLLTECMAEAGMELGLNEELAWQLARATVSGSGELIHLSESSPTQLRENVTSPAGTTEAALKVLMDNDNLKALMKDALFAAKERSKELSG